MEMYGQGSIVAEVNRSRSFLNVQGLNAFDLRIVKPDGQPWNFNVRADRRLARDMISAQDPDWIMGDRTIPSGPLRQTSTLLVFEDAVW